MRAWGLIVFGVSLAAACGGTVQDPEGDPVGGWGGGAAVGGSPSGGSPSGGTAAWPPWDGAVDAPYDAGLDAPEDVRSEYVEPECPDAGGVPPRVECDVYDPYASCATGYACYPFVEYPDPDDPCAVEQYGSICALRGYGEQGDPCADYMNDCSPGFMCVNISGDDTQCIQTCEAFGGAGCPPGLLCRAVDVGPGIGGCY